MKEFPKKKEYIIMDKDTGHIVHEGADRRFQLPPPPWSIFGFTAKDTFKLIIQLGVALFFMTKFYFQFEAMRQFMVDQLAINNHLAVCSENRDKWATAKYGHSFTCGKPDDPNWTPNFGNSKP